MGVEEAVKEMVKAIGAEVDIEEISKIGGIRNGIRIRNGKRWRW